MRDDDGRALALCGFLFSPVQRGEEMRGRRALASKMGMKERGAPLSCHVFVFYETIPKSQRGSEMLGDHIGVSLGSV